MFKHILVQRPNSDNIITLQNRIPGIKRCSLRRTINDNGEASILTEGSSLGEVEKAAVEANGGGEGIGEVEDGGERKEGD